MRVKSLQELAAKAINQEEFNSLPKNLKEDVYELRTRNVLTNLCWLTKCKIQSDILRKQKRIPRKRSIRDIIREEACNFIWPDRSYYYDYPYYYINSLHVFGLRIPICYYYYFLLLPICFFGSIFIDVSLAILLTEYKQVNLLYNFQMIWLSLFLIGIGFKIVGKYFSNTLRTFIRFQILWMVLTGLMLTRFSNLFYK